ncbi:hypothetical protein UY3_18849 [Chelonia mydas]|uniref:Uncharacterized protein n=1 Tax=Chelonia mydas TaxID=8469 RepID=M7B7G6_CHEMY|nr:hypothetical protein UY3_18849 [Chelonia mydas]
MLLYQIKAVPFYNHLAPGAAPAILPASFDTKRGESPRAWFWVQDAAASVTPAELNPNLFNNSSTIAILVTSILTLVPWALPKVIRAKFSVPGRQLLMASVERLCRLGGQSCKTQRILTMIEKRSSTHIQLKAQMKEELSEAGDKAGGEVRTDSKIMWNSIHSPNAEKYIIARDGNKWCDSPPLLHQCDSIDFNGIAPDLHWS